MVVTTKGTEGWAFQCTKCVCERERDGGWAPSAGGGGEAVVDPESARSKLGWSSCHSLSAILTQNRLRHSQGNSQAQWGPRVPESAAGGGRQKELGDVTDTGPSLSPGKGWRSCL